MFYFLLHGGFNVSSLTPKRTLLILVVQVTSSVRDTTATPAG
uniref:Uncharacterized protein n=2 Tax=unclassified Arthrobacter TaxID=235627 RepID=I3W1G7_9MICC|nr:hypothetical protein [Arthrobacter sp. J3.40]AFK89594.1 hypothetical protein [Arthrobacter sp. J3.53]